MACRVILIVESRAQAAADEVGIRSPLFGAVAHHASSVPALAAVQHPQVTGAGDQ